MIANEKILVLKRCTVCSMMKGQQEYIKKCGMCIKCRSNHNKNKRQDNVEKYKEYDKKHYLKNKDKKLKQFADYYANNREKIREATKGIVNDMQPKPGWNIPVSDIGVGVELIELKYGRTAQVQVIIQTDPNEFWCYYEFKK